MNHNLDFSIPVVGEAKVKSPIIFSSKHGESEPHFVSDSKFILYDIDATPDTTDGSAYKKEQLLEVAGPRQTIYFDPAHVHAAIVTAGGLCPGLCVHAPVHRADRALTTSSIRWS